MDTSYELPRALPDIPPRLIAQKGASPWMRYMYGKFGRPEQASCPYGLDLVFAVLWPHSWAEGIGDYPASDDDLMMWARCCTTNTAWLSVCDGRFGRDA